MSIFVHPWDMALGGRHAKYWLPWLVGMPAETATAICALLMGNVLEEVSMKIETNTMNKFKLIACERAVISFYTWGMFR